MIIVFGSIHMDMNLWLHHFPQEGETVIAPDYTMTPGGRGANQALAAARAGVKTALVGKTGDDGMSHRILNNLRRNEVMTSGVAHSEEMPTGMAVKLHTSGGKGRGVAASGANAEISAEQVPDEILRTGNYVLMQMEIPAQENIAVMERAKKGGAKVVMNLAPAITIPQKELNLIDYLIVNQLEAEQIAKVLGVDVKSGAIHIAQALAHQGNLTCIVTLGSQGVVAVTQQGKGWKIPAMKLEKVVDTTGAGDCFCGTLTAALHNGKTLPEAMKRASVAAGLTCCKEGIHSAYPYSGEVEESLSGLPDAEAVEL